MTKPKPPWPRRGLWLALMLPMLHACATRPTPTAATARPEATPPADVACLAFGPLTFSKADTDATIAGIRQYDAAWRALCDPPPKTKT